MYMPFAFFTGAPGPGELILLFVVILVLFGPKRLPEIARMIGRTLDELRRASQDFRDQVMRIEKSPPIDVSSSESRQEEASDSAPHKARSGGRQDQKEKNDFAG